MLKVFKSAKTLLMNPAPLLGMEWNNIAWTLTVFAWLWGANTRAPWPGAVTLFISEMARVTSLLTDVDTRYQHYKVTSAKTDRLARSAIPYMQRLLNANHKRT